MKNLTTYLILLITSVTMVIGCNVEKQTAKRAQRKFYRAADLHLPSVAEGCSYMFPPLDSTGTEYIFVEGETKYNTVTNYDTVVTKDTVRITKTNNIYKVRVDTIHNKVYEKLTDRALETKLRADNNNLSTELTEAKTRLKIYLWLMVGLIIYTLARWILRIWGIKIP